MKFSFFASATIFAAAFLPAALANKDVAHINLDERELDADADIMAAIENMVDIPVVEPSIPITASTSDNEDKDDEHRQRELLRSHHGHVDANHDERLLVEGNHGNCDAETESNLRVSISTDSKGHEFGWMMQERTDNGVGDLIFSQMGYPSKFTFNYKGCFDADKCYKLTFVDTGEDGFQSNAYGIDVVNNGFTMMSVRGNTPQFRGGTIVYVGKCETLTFNVVGGKKAKKRKLRAFFAELEPKAIVVLDRKINNKENFSQDFVVDVSRCYHAVVTHNGGNKGFVSGSIRHGNSVSNFSTNRNHESQLIMAGYCSE